jgi:hypothetical protein
MRAKIKHLSKWGQSVIKEKLDYKYLIFFLSRPAVVETKGMKEIFYFSTKNIRDKIVRFMQDLDQLVRKISLHKDINKKKNKEIARGKDEKVTFSEVTIHIM